jgi:hypothetical protein
VDAGDLVVLERAEGGDQGGDAVGLACVLIAPGAARMEAQDAARDSIVECESAQAKIRFRQRAAWVAGFTPNGAGALDADKIIAFARTPYFDSRVHAIAVEFADVIRCAVQQAAPPELIEHVAHVAAGKGRKDRYVMLSPHLLALRRAWWKAARPQGRRQRPFACELRDTDLPAPAKMSADVAGSRKLDCGTPYCALPLKVLFGAQRKLYHSFEQLVCG